MVQAAENASGNVSDSVQTSSSQIPKELESAVFLLEHGYVEKSHVAGFRNHADSLGVPIEVIDDIIAQGFLKHAHDQMSYIAMGGSGVHRSTWVVMDLIKSGDFPAEYRDLSMSYLKASLKTAQLVDAYSASMATGMLDCYFSQN
ncbi:MAG: hypothetical protein GY861_13485 [bacterium]|nr:hypothetical protein [bacterium]